MMTEHGLEVQTISYLKKLKKFYLLRWKTELSKFTRTTENLHMIQSVIKRRLNTKYGVIAFPKDEERDEGILRVNYHESER